MARKKKKKPTRRNGTAKPATKSSREHRLYDSRWIAGQLEDFAGDIINQGSLEDSLIVGIQPRGALLAERVCKRIGELTDVEPDWGALDITLYRDDLMLHSQTRKLRKPGGLHGTKLRSAVDRRVVHLIDDVLYTGRTIRAAMDQLMDFGRPARVRLYSLLDRGGRELPIQPDRLGTSLMVSAGDRIEVRLKDLDGTEGVFVVADDLL